MKSSSGIWTVKRALGKEQGYDTVVGGVHPDDVAHAHHHGPCADER
jgi:hypothetical protein